MRDRRQRWVSGVGLLLVLTLAAPAWSGHGKNESTPNYSAGCSSRDPETPRSLRELLELLQGPHGVMSVGDRLRCAVQKHPGLALRLLLPLLESRHRDVALMAAKMLGELGPQASRRSPGLAGHEPMLEDVVDLAALGGGSRPLVELHGDGDAREDRGL